MEQFLKLFILIASVTLVSGCKKELPNPELLDPIYKDLLSEKKEAEKALKEEEAKLESLLAERGKIEPRSVDRKINIRGTKKSRKNVLKLRQKLKYLEIRSERRRVEARRDYRIAFQKGEEWPKKEEFVNYQTHKRLRNAPKNWNLRVPKLHARNPNFKAKKK